MIILILFGCVFIGTMLFLVIRLSVSFMFWISKKLKNKQHVFKIYFPYYIILLFGLCATPIIIYEANSFFNYFCGSIFLLALLIWRHEMKHILNTHNKTKIAVEPNLTIYHEQPIS